MSASGPRYVVVGTDIRDNATGRVARFQNKPIAQIGADWLNGPPDATPEDYTWTDGTSTAIVPCDRLDWCRGHGPVRDGSHTTSITVGDRLPMTLRITLVEGVDSARWEFSLHPVDEWASTSTNFDRDIDEWLVSLVHARAEIRSWLSRHPGLEASGAVMSR